MTKGALGVGHVRAGGPGYFRRAQALEATRSV
jgi:hypothetical protein